MGIFWSIVFGLIFYLIYFPLIFEMIRNKPNDFIKVKDSKKYLMKKVKFKHGRKL